MKIYLLDTNIVSEPTKLSPNEKVIQKLAYNLILVTRNVSDFADIVKNSNLMIENWFEE